MLRRLGPGPVFVYEWLLTSRRWQVYAGRVLFVAGLLAGLTVVWLVEIAGKPRQSIRSQVAVGETFFYAIIGTQLAVVLLAAPAATAGSICQEKTRGTLSHVLVTDLSNTEIVLGKLAARLVPVFGMVASGLPVLFLSMLLGGIDPAALSAAFLITLAVGLFGCSLALAFSVWGNKTHEVLLATYLVFALWLLAAPTCAVAAMVGALGTGAPQWMWSANPFWVALAPYLAPTAVGFSDCLAFVQGAVLVSAALLAVSVLRVRAVYLHQLGKPPKGKRWLGRWSPRLRWPAWLPSPSLDGNPVLWREWHRAQPSRWTRVVWLIYGTLATVFSLWAIGITLRSPARGISSEFGVFVNAFQCSVGLLLLSVSAATSLAEERSRGSLDVVLATPLSTRTIVWGKWWGAFRTVPKLVVLPGMVIGAIAARGPEHRWPAALILVTLLLAYGAAITSLGLALATWISRFGRVVAVSVATYVVMTVGWFFLMLAIFNDNDFWGPGLASGSPFWGTAFMTLSAIGIGPSSNEFAHYFGWGTCWTVAYSIAAVGLYLATLFSFDRCLGRIPDSRFSPPDRFRQQVEPVQLVEAKSEV